MASCVCLALNPQHSSLNSMVSVVYVASTPACEARSMGSTPVGESRIGNVTRLECVMSEIVLQRPTLILNRNWQPVNVATVARALVLLWNEAARVVDPEDYQLYTWADWSRLAPHDGDAFIHALRLRLRVPEVIVLASYDRLPPAAVS